jgi:TRAP-type mannitol/chloroaromatic compound transport system permease small subunit
VNILKSLNRWIGKINEWIARIVAWFVAIIFVLLIMEVVRRYLFNSPTVWANELSQMLFGSYAVLSGGFLLYTGGHVNVDIVYGQLSPRTRSLLDIITSPLFFAFAGMLLYYGGSLAFESLSALEHSESAWNPPLYPFKLTIPVAAGLLVLQGVGKLVQNILILSGKTETSEAESKESGLL